MVTRIKGILDPDDTGVTELNGIGVIETPDPEIALSNDQYNILIYDQISNAYLYITNGRGESILNYNIYNSPFSKTFSTPDEQSYFGLIQIMIQIIVTS